MKILYDIIFKAEDDLWSGLKPLGVAVSLLLIFLAQLLYLQTIVVNVFEGFFLSSAFILLREATQWWNDIAAAEKIVCRNVIFSSNVRLNFTPKLFLLLQHRHSPQWSDVMNALSLTHRGEGKTDLSGKFAVTH